MLKCISICHHSLDPKLDAPCFQNLTIVQVFNYIMGCSQKHTRCYLVQLIFVFAINFQYIKKILNIYTANWILPLNRYRYLLSFHNNEELFPNQTAHFNTKYKCFLSLQFTVFFSVKVSFTPFSPIQGTFKY